MKNIEKQCRQIAFAAAHLRDGCCQISGDSFDSHCHHLMGRHNWVLAFDVDYLICLSTEWHGKAHGAAAEKKEMMDKLIARLMQLDEPRATKILKMQAGPKPPICEPVWSDVLTWVKVQYKKIEAAQQWTDDIEPAPGRTMP